MHELATGRYLEEKSPVFIVGPCGTGKSRLANLARVPLLIIDDFGLKPLRPSANKLLASATLDRLRHNADCLVLDGTSYRAPRQLPTVIHNRLASGSKAAQA